MLEEVSKRPGGDPAGRFFISPCGGMGAWGHGGVRGVNGIDDNEYSGRRRDPGGRAGRG